MTKRSNLITAIVVGILVISVLLIYKFKPESSATTLSTTGIIQLSANQNNVAVYWKYPLITSYVKVTTIITAGVPVKITCKRGYKYSMKLTKTGFYDYTYTAYCPQTNGTIQLRRK